MEHEKADERAIVRVRSNASSINSSVLHAADDARLAELGYKSEFKREFSVRLKVYTGMGCA